MSRECGLVNPNARIYVPRFIHGSPIDPDAVITWENVDGGSSKVDATTYEEVHCDEQPPRNARLNESPVRSAGSHPKSMSGSEYYLAITGDVLSWMLDFATEESLQKVCPNLRTISVFSSY